MTTNELNDNKSRWSILSDIQAMLNQLVEEKQITNQGIKRLDNHMQSIILDYRQRLEAAESANEARFPPAGTGARPAQNRAGGSAGYFRSAGTPLAAGDVNEGYGRVRSIGFIPGHIDESFL